MNISPEQLYEMGGNAINDEVNQRIKFFCF